MFMHVSARVRREWALTPAAENRISEVFVAWGRQCTLELLGGEALSWVKRVVRVGDRVAVDCKWLLQGSSSLSSTAPRRELYALSVAMVERWADTHGCDMCGCAKPWLLL